MRSALLEALPAGGLSMQAVCGKLGVSSRTLQRRLQDEGTSFQQTLDNLRNALAHHYLQNSLMSGAEIAFLLGFEDPNSFIRATSACGYSSLCSSSLATGITSRSTKKAAPSTGLVRISALNVRRPPRKWPAVRSRRHNPVRSARVLPPRSVEGSQGCQQRLSSALDSFGRDLAARR